MRSTPFVTLILAAALATAASGCASKTVYVAAPPPAVRAEVKPVRPGPAYVWKAGHWEWRRGRHVWVGGHWVKAKKNAVWVPGHWKKTPRGWVWKAGRWKKR